MGAFYYMKEETETLTQALKLMQYHTGASADWRIIFM
jgi:hypothetical protein